MSNEQWWGNGSTVLKIINNYKSNLNSPEMGFIFLGQNTIFILFYLSFRNYRSQLR